MQLGTPAMSLADLPDACILTALLFLDVRDALRTRQTCRRMHLLLEQSQNHFWLPRLRMDFGLRLQVCCPLHTISQLAVLGEHTLAGAV